MKCKNCNNLYNMIDIKGEIVARCCSRIGDSVDIEIDRECDKYEGITNADRIRNMTDEELSRFLYSDYYCFDCTTCKEPVNEEGACIGECRNELLRWLQKEVE